MLPPRLAALPPIEITASYKQPGSCVSAQMRRMNRGSEPSMEL